MIKLIKAIFILLLMSHTASAQRASGPAAGNASRMRTPPVISKKNFKPAATELNLKGQVKSIQEYTFKGEMKNGKIEKAGDIERNELNTFDKDGNRIQEEIFHMDGSFYLASEYSYSKPGMLSKAKRFFGNKRTDVTATDVYEYNENDYLISTTEYDNLMKIKNQQKYNYVFNYRTNEYTQKLDTICFRDKADKLKCIYQGDYAYYDKYVYDTDTNLISKMIKKEANHSVVTYQYNSAKQIKYEVYLDNHLKGGENYDTLFTISYEYDNNGNISKQFGTGSADHSKSYDYVYDAKGNWIKRVSHTVQLDSHEDLYFINERKIEYFQ